MSNFEQMSLAEEYAPIILHVASKRGFKRPLVGHDS